MHRALATLTLLTLAACEAGTGDLTPGRGDASIRDALAADAQPRDGSVECTRAAECTMIGRPCDDVRNCKCGCFDVCSSGRCTGFCDDSPQCHPQPDAGVQPECSNFTDCPNGQPPRICPQAQSSCGFGECVVDCAGPRTCTMESDGCVACMVPSRPLRTVECPACIMLAIGDGVLEESTCDLGVQLNELVSFTPQADCSWHVGIGGREDRVVALSNGGFVGYLERFASPCLVSFAPTGLLRTVWACPDCTFTFTHR